MVTTVVPYGAWSVVTALVLGILLLAKLLTSSKHKNLPPGPRGLPFIGAIQLLGKHPHWGFAKLAETYGPLMSFRSGPRLAVVASSPAMAEEILKTQGPNFSNRLKTTFAEMDLPADIALVSDSPIRLHLKKMLHTQLSTSRQLQQTTNVRTEEIAHVLHVIPQDGATMVPVRTYIEVAITNIMSRMILKKRFMPMAIGEDHKPELEQVNKFRRISDDIAKHLHAIDLGDFIPIFKWTDFFGIQKSLQNLKARMDAFMSTIITEHVVQRKSGSFFVKDFVDVLLDQKEDQTLQFDVTDVNIISTLWAFTGNTTPTTITIEWVIVECICNPEVMKKAQIELDTIVGKSRRVEDVDIPNLHFVDF